MIYSMTGFGREILEYQGKKITIDIRTLNSKSADISTRIYALYKDKDIEIRRALTQGLQRGKIDFSMMVEVESDLESCPVNSKMAISIYKKLVEDCRNSGIVIDNSDNNTLISSIIRIPDVLQNISKDVSDEEWNAILACIERAVKKCNEYRKEEGKSIEKDILEKIKKILLLLGEIPKYEKERIDVIKDHLRQSIEELKLNDGTSENRYEQEIIFYLEKLDINEEKVRLKKHCEYFIETVNAEDFSGKKLGFIAQEMGREINTLGSKAHHAEMQKIVVMMKDELEKIKEQSLNIL